MKVSILSFNHPNITRQCVDQTLLFVAPENVILVHNGSRPENVRQLQENYPHIDHMIIAENKGFTHGMNQLLKYTFQKTEWCLVLTNDCLLISKPSLPSHTGIYAPLIFRRKTDKIDSAGAIFYPLRKKLIHIKDISIAHRWIKKTNKMNGTRPKVFTNKLQILSKKLNLFSKKLNEFMNSINGYFYVPGTAFYMDAATFEKVGLFDESLHTYWEDVDYSVRAHKQSIHLGLMLETRIIHKVGKTCHKDPFYTQYLFIKNRKTISKRYSLF